MTKEQQDREFLTPLFGGTLDQQIEAIETLLTINDKTDKDVFSDDEMEIMKALYVSLLTQKRFRDKDNKLFKIGKNVDKTDYSLISYRNLETALRKMGYNDGVNWMNLRKIELRVFAKCRNAYKTLVKDFNTKNIVNDIFDQRKMKTNFLQDRPKRFYPIDDFEEWRASDNNI